MSFGSLALRSDRVVLPDGVTTATVVVRDGRIVEVRRGPAQPGPADLPLVDLPGLVLSPGLVDAHVHVNEPGRTEWEGFACATRAAAAGGVTTIVDMPLNSVPPTTTAEALRVKRAAAAGQAWVDIGFWGGLTSADTGHVDELVDAGVCGLKVFLAPSGVPEFGHVDGSGLAAALAAGARRGVPVLVHAEAPAELAAAPPPTGPSYGRWLASRPAAAEVAAIRQVVATACRTGGRAHVLHLSAAAALPVLAAGRSAGAPVSVETCPHYLSLCAEELPDGATEAKCAPPVREAAN
ncbi:MAG TPA: amidohydrolase family protein, partial [Mycobacteriales bacterium]|nr:amidohydrolase family protein [Mycobacteriales bacterium]